MREQKAKQLKQNCDQQGSFRKQLEDVRGLFSEKLQQMFCSLGQLSILVLPHQPAVSCKGESNFCEGCKAEKNWPFRGIKVSISA